MVSYCEPTVAMAAFSSLMASVIASAASPGVATALVKPV